MALKVDRDSPDFASRQLALLRSDLTTPFGDFGGLARSADQTHEAARRTPQARRLRRTHLLLAIGRSLRRALTRH